MLNIYPEQILVIKTGSRYLWQNDEISLYLLRRSALFLITGIFYSFGK